jgi:ABC-type sugar transport system permease subunit
MRYFLVGLRTSVKSQEAARSINRSVQVFRHHAGAAPVMAFIAHAITALQLVAESILLDINGGSRNSGMTMTMYLYSRGFRELKMSYASAIGYSLAMIIIALTVLQLILVRAFRED